MPDTWPRLSETLTHPREPGICQSCGTTGTTRWQEHDQADRPEPIIVQLCNPCGKRLIKPHPRLYRELAKFEPWPGLEEFCRHCLHRDGMRCLMATMNGGTGIQIRAPFTSAFVCRGAGRGGARRIFHGPPLGCDFQQSKEEK